MTLHEAIKTILQEHVAHSMTTSEIACALNKRSLYQKTDRTEITDYQVHGRTKNYPHIFSREGVLVSLIEE